MKKWIIGVVALMLVSIAPVARAGTVTIIEPVEGGTDWTLIVAGIPAGTGLNGTFTVPGTSEAVTIVYAHNRVAAATTSVVGVLFDDRQLTVASDILQFNTVQGSSAFVNITVTSEAEAAALTVPGGITTGVLEDGTPQFVGTITYTDGTSDQVFLQSDVEPVPEPGTLTLFGVGIAGLAGYGWRRRRAVAS